ncbi:hypothetical protein [Winogradskyella wichelsiae]|uniref:hypothetical protein n=1 Tax=Winogradskyella wichelsiae TaxID=2697007 RepID=UPI0015C81C4B|nr:hypothetical protein [Winogradskyella wichelsiae]
MDKNCISIISFHPDNEFCKDVLKLAQKHGYNNVNIDTSEINNDEPRLVMVVNDEIEA